MSEFCNIEWKQKKTTMMALPGAAKFEYKRLRLRAVPRRSVRTKAPCQHRAVHASER